MYQDIHKASGSSKTNRRTFILVTFFTVLLATLFSSFAPTEDQFAAEQIDKNVVTAISGILQCLDSLDLLLHKGSHKTACRQQYEKARGFYKEIEFYTEYHFSFHSKQFINAPLVNKAEFEYNYKTFVPHGFQVIETVLYASEPDTSINTTYELALLRQTFKYVSTKSRDKQFKNSTVVDMLRFELLRVMSLYLNGYDCTVNKQNLAEIKHILKSMEQTLELLPATSTEKAEGRSI